MSEQDSSVTATRDPLAWAIRWSELDDSGKVTLFGLALAMRDGRSDYPRDIEDVAGTFRWLRDNGYADRAREALTSAR